VPVEEIVGMNRSQMYPLEDRERNKRIFQKNVGMDRVVTSEDIFILHLDRRKIPVEIISNILVVDNNKEICESLNVIPRIKLTGYHI
jgi:hypothetical protein